VVPSESPGRWCVVPSESPGRWCVVPSESPGRWCGVVPSESPGRWCVVPSESPGLWCVVPSESPGRCVSQPCAAATRMGRRASLSVHGPDRTAELIHYTIGDSPLTLRVGRNLHGHRRAGKPFVSSTRDRGRDRPMTGAF
jgi:hypothetical protein